MLLEIIAISAGLTFAVTACNCFFWPKVRQTKQSLQNKVSVLIPARNEEANLPSCLESVLAQGAIVSEILVYDDHSSDRTAQIIDDFAAQHPQVKRVSALPLPAGWCGKNYACMQLAKKASGDWLLFLDADARLYPNAVNRMVAEALARQVSFLSCWPKFEMQGRVEKTLMPMLNFVVFSLFPTPLTLLRQPQFQSNSALGLGHGACLLFERSSYNSFGGHERVKDQIFEDTRISQLWRASGRAGLCLDGQEIVWLRMYSSLREIWAGFQKNFYPAFTLKFNFWLFLALHFLVFLCPFFIVAISESQLALVGVTFILLSRLFLIVRFHHSPLSLFLHPLGELVLICLGLSSWWKYKTGKGVAWKGREYPRSA